MAVTIFAIERANGEVITKGQDGVLNILLCASISLRYWEVTYIGQNIVTREIFDVVSVSYARKEEGE